MRTTHVLGLNRASMLVALCFLVVGMFCGTAANAADRGINLMISSDTLGTEYSQRFSWLHWWETQRAKYQRFATAEQRVEWATNRLAAIEPMRQQLIDELTPVVKDASADPYVRSGAVMALARMRYEELVDLIVSDKAPPAGTTVRVGPSGQSWPVGLIGDDNVRVRVAGWLALGLLDTEKSRAKLVDEFAWAVTTDDQVARLTAFGFLKELTSEERDFVIMKMRNSKIAEVQRMALWALDQHDTKDNDKIMMAAIRELQSPYSVAQAMQATGPMSRQNMHKLLDMAIANPDKLVNDVSVYNHIKNGTVWQSTCTFGVREQLTISAMFALANMDPAPSNMARTIYKTLEETITEGQAAPGMHEAPLKEHTGNDRDKFGPVADYERGPAGLALAMQPAPGNNLVRHVDTLHEMLEGKTKVRVLVYPRDKSGKKDEDRKPGWDFRSIEQKLHPARGYAPVAMGLILQRMNPDTLLGQSRPLSPGDARAASRISRTLIQTLENTREFEDIRCSAAIAMGLSGSPTFRKPLHETLSGLGADDAALYGYIVEALGMLDDPDVPKLAEQYLLKAKSVGGDHDVLARRAIASALVFSKQTSEDIDEMLIEAWPKDPWAGLAIAKASAVRGGPKMVSYLLEKVTDPIHGQAAAMSLAEVVDPQSAWRLSSLTDDMNYTLDYRVPIEVGWNPYKPGDQEPLPTRLVHGFDNTYLMHNLLMRRLPPAGSFADFQNDDSNGQDHFIFKLDTKKAEK